MKKLFNHSCYIICISSFLFSCSVSKQINKQAQQLLFADSAISQGHIGISVYDPSANKYLYNHNADKYFIPASNTKLFSWYAGMKYLGDSLVGLRYKLRRELNEDVLGATDSLIYADILSTGDPTFMHPDFPIQPVYNFLNTATDRVRLLGGPGITNPYGRGWTKDDYNEAYMAPRSAFPIYGNVATFKIDKKELTVSPYFLVRNNNLIVNSETDNTEFKRREYDNRFSISYKWMINYKISIPFYPDGYATQMLADTLKKEVSNSTIAGFHSGEKFKKYYYKDIIYSQPSDSLFKPMMHRSDNFFAEQTLLMASNEYLGYMSDRDIIDTILKSTLKDIPQKPRWVDGSGLSRYNLFTPQDFVWLLNKTKNEFDWERITNILPTGGEGTLSAYYKEEKGFIYAKTGTLSNNCALSGYLITKKNKVLIFSVLVNNYPTSATPVRRAVEKFIKQLREKY